MIKKSRLEIGSFTFLFDLTPNMIKLYYYPIKISVIHNRYSIVLAQ